jgi:FtsZ-binding cell division protein ZapB
MTKNHIRVYLGVELPGYEFCTSWVYEIYYGPLNDADKGLAAFIEMHYKDIEKMNKSNVSISYDCYKSVIADNDRLRDEINHLKKESQAWKDKYFQEKLDHTTTEARIVYAKHILSGNRDKDVVENVKHNFIDRYGEC